MAFRTHRIAFAAVGSCIGMSMPDARFVCPWYEHPVSLSSVLCPLLTLIAWPRAPWRGQACGPAAMLASRQTPDHNWRWLQWRAFPALGLFMARAFGQVCIWFGAAAGGRDSGDKPQLLQLKVAPGLFPILLRESVRPSLVGSSLESWGPAVQTVACARHQSLPLEQISLASEIIATSWRATTTTTTTARYRRP